MLCSHRENLGILWGFIGVVIFAASLPMTRALLKHVAVLDIAITRTLPASAAIIYLVARGMWRKTYWPVGQSRHDILLGSVGIVFGFPILTAVGMQYAPATYGTLILDCLPLLTAIFGALFNNERPSPGFWAASLPGLVLMVAFAVMRAGHADVHPLWLWGYVALIVAAVLASTGYALGGKAAQSLDALQVTCWMLVLSLPMQVVLAVFCLNTQAVWAMPSTAWVQMMVPGLGCTLIGFFFWYAGLARGGIACVSQMQYAQSFLTVLIAVLFLKEIFTQPCLAS